MSFLWIALVPGRAFAGGLTVAAEPPARTAGAQSDSFGGDVEEKPREGVSIAAASYVFCGSAIDDFKQGGFIVRPEVELYAAFGLGDVTLLVGGTVLGVEGTHFDNRDGMSVPVLGTIGVRDDSWHVAAAGGISVATDDSYGDILDEEESSPSPRGEVRAGYRFANFGELTGIVGAERRLWTNREDATRLFFGMAIGIGYDENQK